MSIDEILKTISQNNGIVGFMLIWFLLRYEVLLKKVNKAINNNSKALLLNNIRTNSSDQIAKQSTELYKEIKKDEEKTEHKKVSINAL